MCVPRWLLIKPKSDALFLPVDWRPAIGHQLGRSEFYRLPALEDRAGDVGGQEAQAKQPCELGTAYAGFLCHLGYGATAGEEDRLEFICPGD